MPETRERGENRQKKFKHCHDSYASRRTFIKGDAFIIEVFQIVKTRRNNSKDGTSIKQNRTTRHVDHIKQRYFKPSVKLDNPDESRYTDIRRWDSFILKECNATLPLSTISPSSWSCSEHSHSMDLSGRLSNSLNKLLKGKGRILCHLVDRLCCLNTSLNCLS